MTDKTQGEIDEEVARKNMLGYSATANAKQNAYLNNVPEDIKPVIENIQRITWLAALEWERTSPDSLSSKRIQELKKIIE